MARAALDASIAYATEREQFGMKISKFQGLRWIIADMATEIEAGRQLMLSAAAMNSDAVAGTIGGNVSSCTSPSSSTTSTPTRSR